MFNDNNYVMWTEDTLQGLLDNSDTMQWADVASTIDNVGAYDALCAARYVMATMEAHGDGGSIGRALEKPWQFATYWLPALAIYGKLYAKGGIRLYQMEWDFDISDDYTFTLKVKEDAE